MGILNTNMTEDLGRINVSESKGTPYFTSNLIDFENFYQKSLLPKELKKLNPALYGRDTSSLMRWISPVYREPTEEEKDIIKIKYDLVYEVLLKYLAKWILKLVIIGKI